MFTESGHSQKKTKKHSEYYSYSYSHHTGSGTVYDMHTECGQKAQIWKYGMRGFWKQYSHA